MSAFGENEVGYDAQDQSTGDRGNVNIADAHSHATDAGNQDGGSGKQVCVILKIYLLDHLQAGAGNETVQGDANTAHNAAGNGIQECHKGAEEGDDNAQHSGGGDGHHGGVTGDSDATNGLAVGGVGAAAEESANHRTNAVAQQGAVQAGVLQQVLADNGGKVLVVCQVLSEYDEGDGDICDCNSSQIGQLKLFNAL